jgi:hypothetical protein
MSHDIEIDSRLEQWILRSIPNKKIFHDPLFSDLDQKIRISNQNLDSLDECFRFGVQFGAELADQWRQHGRLQEEPITLSQENLSKDELKNTLEFFQEGQEAVNRCIDELSISEDSKRYLHGTIDNVTVRFSGLGDHLTTLESDIFIITLNLNDLREMDRLVPQWFGEPESGQFSRAIRLILISHELGHVIGIAMTTNRNVFEERAPVKYGDSGMKEYPIVFNIPDGPEKENSVEQVFFDVAKNERFASYFSFAIQQGLGLSSHIVIDEALVHFIPPYQTGLSMEQLQYIFDGLQKQLYYNEFTTPEDREKYGVNLLNADLYMALYKNDGMHMLFPFSRAAVEHVIVKAWPTLLKGRFRHD